ALPIYRGRRRRGPYRRRKPWIRGNGSVDWDELLTIALEVGWTQEQFWSSTPHELSLAVEAHRRKEEAAYERAAWIAAVIINHMPTFSKHRPPPVTPDQLLGRNRSVDVSQFGSREEFREYMRRQLERLEEEDRKSTRLNSS